MAGIEGLDFDHVALSVADLERSRRWYEEVLGLTRRYEDAWPDFPVVMCAGDACLALFPGREGPETGGFRHVAFRTDRAGFSAATSALRDRGLEPQFEDHGICHSVYVSDPDGYQVEITTYDL